MIDIHCHILPNLSGFDDGAKNFEEALALIKQGQEDGIQGAVLTPHILGDLDANIDRLYRERFSNFKNQLAESGVDFELYLASEIMFQFGLEKACDLEVATFNGNKRYLLVEFPQNMYSPQFKDALFNLQVKGLTPIIAHPERNGVLSDNLPMIAELIHRGALFQSEANSLTGRLGRQIRQAVEKLLKAGLIHFIASDAHNIRRRQFKLSSARRIVEDMVGENVAEELFYRNPRKAILGEKIQPPQFDYSMETSPGFWRKILRKITYSR